MVVYTCKPSYMENISRKTALQPDPWPKCKTLPKKITELKRA
jgi:hypothetical protein